jgi:DNA polymerase-3 subunit gamma/tau
VIENLNVLDYEYYFKSTAAALMGDVSSVLLTFNEVLEKGFDGNNFISGLNSHFRDLLICKDEATIRLLEATPAVKQRYLQQTSQCPVDFLFKALEIGSNCDLSYKNSKNPRLHIELSLIKLCRLIEDSAEGSEKKKSDTNLLKSADEELPLPSKSEIIREEIHSSEKKAYVYDSLPGKHDPVIEKPSKTFSIKEIISDDKGPAEKAVLTNTTKEVEGEIPVPSKEIFSAEAFEAVWNEFTNQLKGEGPRIISMFKMINPEVDSDNTIRIHLSNAAQKDIFILNYKQKLINYLETRFIMSDIDIETIVDLTEANEILYSDEQKYNYLFNKYPVLKDMKRAFNLDIT